MDDTGAERHLTDEEIFALAAPAAGEPEALPRHLAHCGACGRALQEWKTALHEVADEDLGPVGRRSAEEWRAAEDATLSVIRRSGRRPSSRRALRWAMGIAASLVLVALAMPFRTRSASPGTAAGAEAGAGSASASMRRAGEDSLSAADRDDDALLRDAAYLAQGGGDGTGADIALEESL